jgi:hypothetical protein
MGNQKQYRTIGSDRKRDRGNEKYPARHKTVWCVYKIKRLSARALTREYARMINIPVFMDAQNLQPYISWEVKRRDQ